MLAPEISNFPPPKVHLFAKEDQKIETAFQLIGMNHFYKSVIVACPDEHNTTFIQDVIEDDTEYYKLYNCPVTELTNEDFIGYFVKCGKVTCLSADRNCIVQDCAAITPDGILTIHVMEVMYQTLGLQGTKRPCGYYEVQIDLKCLKQFEKIHDALSKLEVMDFYITWEPHKEIICPSSVARYFWDRNIHVTSHKMTFQHISPEVKQIPTLVDIEVEDMVEWMGILAHNGDTSPTEYYINTYSQPNSLAPIYSTRISILIAKGFITPIVLNKLSRTLADYAEEREPHNYWVAMSMQGNEESLWKMSPSSPRMFQSHNSSASIFFTRNGCTIYSTCQLKYS